CQSFASLAFGCTGESDRAAGMPRSRIFDPRLRRRSSVMSKKGINRRQFLHTSGLVVASAALASGGGVLFLHPSTAWATPFSTLDEHTAKTLVKMSRHLYPSKSIDDDEYAKTIEGFDAKAKT